MIQVVEPFVPAARDGAEVIYKLKELLKACGWEVKYSGAGGLYGGGEDVITGFGAGAGGMGSAGAWFVIGKGGRELLFRRVDSTDWDVRYSRDGLFGDVTAGDAATVAEASDQQNLAVASSGPLFYEAISTGEINMQKFAISADDAGLGFACVGWAQWDNGGVGSPETRSNRTMMALACDPTSPSGHDDGLVFYAPTHTSLTDRVQARLSNDSMASDTGLGGGLGFCRGAWRRLGASQPSAYVAGPNSLVLIPSEFSGGYTQEDGVDREPLSAPVWMDPAGAAGTRGQGVKGKSSMFRWTLGNPSGATADPLSGTTLYTSDPTKPDWLVVSYQSAIRWGGEPAADNRAAYDLDPAGASAPTRTAVAPAEFPADREQARRQALSFTHTRGAGAASVLVWATIGSERVLVYDGGGFTPLFEGASTVEISGSEFAFALLPAGGWWGDVELDSADAYVATVV